MPRQFFDMFSKMLHRNRKHKVYMHTRMYYNYICHFLMKIKAEKQFSSSGHQKSGFEDFPQRFFEFGAKLSSYSIVLLVFVASLM